MSRNQKVHGVLLTDQAWEGLSDALDRYASTGSIGQYIYCREVNPHGHYLVMVITCKNPDGSSFEAEISLPHHYVKCVIAASAKTQIGFIQDAAR